MPVCDYIAFSPKDNQRIRHVTQNLKKKKIDSKTLKATSKMKLIKFYDSRVETPITALKDQEETSLDQALKVHWFEKE